MIANAEWVQQHEAAGVLDFSDVQRIDTSGVQALEKLADQTVLRGVNTNVYKVLKLLKLAPRFRFVE